MVVKRCRIEEGFWLIQQLYCSVFMNVIISLNRMLVADKIRAAVNAKAKGYIDNLLMFDTILTVHVYLQIYSDFKVSKIMKLDVVNVHRIVDELLENMQMLQDFHNGAGKSGQWVNDQPVEMDGDFVMEESLPI